MDYGTKVRVMRAVRGLSQTDLADVSGVASYHLSLIESGKFLPGEEAARQIRISLGWPAKR